VEDSFGLFGTDFTSGSVIGPILETWIYDTYRSTVFNILGVNVPGYGIPFFINAALGNFSTTKVLIIMEEPKEEDKHHSSPWLMFQIPV